VKPLEGGTDEGPPLCSRKRSKIVLLVEDQGRAQWGRTGRQVKCDCWLFASGGFGDNNKLLNNYPLRVEVLDN
jgi:hypothetical protein